MKITYLPTTIGRVGVRTTLADLQEEEIALSEHNGKRYKIVDGTYYVYESGYFSRLRGWKESNFNLPNHKNKLSIRYVVIVEEE